MNDFTLLTEEQIFGDNKLDILKKYGTKAAVTDFAILLGVGVSEDCHTNEGNSKKDRTGWWWTKTSHNGYVGGVLPDGDRDSYVYSTLTRYCGVRPALPYSSISLIFSNRVKKYGILEVECGEYPQTVVPEDFSKTLESAYFNRTLNQTGKSYTTDSVKSNNHNTPFQARSHIEYEYNGRKYIRFVGDSNCSGEVLSDGRIIQKGVPYWIEVEPIKWLIDEKTNIVLSKKLIFSGVQFDREVNYNGDFYGTDIKEFMDKHFSKDITPSFLKKIPSEDNPYGFNFEQVSEEDIVKEAIESGFALLLHSKLSVDKSAKVKQLDPDCEIIYMRNATPDSLNGKSVYNTEKAYLRTV